MVNYGKTMIYCMQSSPHQTWIDFGPLTNVVFTIFQANWNSVTWSLRHPHGLTKDSRHTESSRDVSTWDAEDVKGYKWNATISSVVYIGQVHAVCNCHGSSTILYMYKGSTGTD